MNRIITYILVLVAFCFVLRCSSNVGSKKENENALYFKNGELSDDNFSDSIANRFYSQELRLINEPSLKDSSFADETIRLVVSSVVYNLYSIRIDRHDSTCFVTIKILPADSPWIINNENKQSKPCIGALYKLGGGAPVMPGYTFGLTCAPTVHRNYTKHNEMNKPGGGLNVGGG